MKIPPFKIEQFIKNIANEKIAGCLLFGPETALAEYRFNLIAKQIVADLSDSFLVSNLSKERISTNKGILADEFYSFSMMGGRKLIILKDLDVLAADELKILFNEEGFNEKSDNFILIKAGDLKASSALRKQVENNLNFAAIACYEDNEQVIKSFISDELKRREIAFDRDILDILLEKFGKNRQIILLEIEKILTFLGKDENKKIDIDIVNKLTKSESENSIDEFVINFSSKNYKKAHANLENLYRNNVEPITLMRYLNNYFLKLYAAKKDIEVNKSTLEMAIKNQKVFFKAENLFKMHLQAMSLKNISKKIDIFESLEIEMKKGLVSARLILSSFVQKFL
jgi:DNA polymerase-3 subunit delta